MTQSILITRPAHQAGPLSQGIKKAGGQVLLFPTLSISAITPTNQDNEILKHINDYDIIVFISPNAVEHGINLIQSSTQLADSTLLATVGQGSAKALHDKLGKKADIVPEENFNSEGLLATPAMQNVANKKILIIRGNGGREFLNDSLLKRGANVDYLNVYQRIKPDTPTKELELHLQNNQIAAIVITSGESLKNLLELVPEKVKHLLLKVPLLLINQRLLEIARQAGFSDKLYIANVASDDAIIETLKENKLLS